MEIFFFQVYYEKPVGSQLLVLLGVRSPAFLGDPDIYREVPPPGRHHPEKSFFTVFEKFLVVVKNTQKWPGNGQKLEKREGKLNCHAGFEPSASQRPSNTPRDMQTTLLLVCNSVVCHKTKFGMLLLLHSSFFLNEMLRARFWRLQSLPVPRCRRLHKGKMQNPCSWAKQLPYIVWSQQYTVLVEQSHSSAREAIRVSSGFFLPFCKSFFRRFYGGQSTLTAIGPAQKDFFPFVFDDIKTKLFLSAISCFQSLISKKKIIQSNFGLHCCKQLRSGWFCQ